MARVSYPPAAVIKGTLLHEMIHAYEDQLPFAYREWLLLHIFDALTKKMRLRKLRRFIDVNNHSLFIESGHGELFLLKSVDLDLRCNLEPGVRRHDPDRWCHLLRGLWLSGLRLGEALIQQVAPPKRLERDVARLRRYKEAYPRISARSPRVPGNRDRKVAGVRPLGLGRRAD